MTIELMREAVRKLTRSIRYKVPPQDLRVSLRHFPAGPAGGFRIDGVRVNDGPGRQA